MKRAARILVQHLSAPHLYAKKQLCWCQSCFAALSECRNSLLCCSHAGFPPSFMLLPLESGMFLFYFLMHVKNKLYKHVYDNVHPPFTTSVCSNKPTTCPLSLYTQYRELYSNIDIDFLFRREQQSYFFKMSTPKKGKISFDVNYCASNTLESKCKHNRSLFNGLLTRPNSLVLICKGTNIRINDKWGMWNARLGQNLQKPQKTIPRNKNYNAQQRHCKQSAHSNTSNNLLKAGRLTQIHFRKLSKLQMKDEKAISKKVSV